MPERPKASGIEVSRLLVQKRCEVYSQAAALIMEIEEALDGDDALRTRYLIQDLRRCLRSALAFLTEEVYQQLERLEGLALSLPEGEAAVAPDLAQELTDRVQMLHVKLARSLELPTLQDLSDIVGLSPRLKRRIAAEGRERETKARWREVEDQCWKLEGEARELIKQKQYPKAIKGLRRAVRLDPTRAVLHNDLGVALSLQEKNEEAVEAYRKAVALNEKHPERRTDEWTTSYYNLGIALRKVAQASVVRGELDRSSDHLREACEAFREYTRLNATGPKVRHARDLVEQISNQLHQFEASGEPGLT